MIPLGQSPSMQPEIFWGEVAPCEHLVQFYDDDQPFLDSLEGFVHGGIRAGDAVIVIATQNHREALERRLTAAGCDLRAARAKDQYISVDADNTLAMFMVNGWPQDGRFEQTVTQLIARARQNGRRVRAFGEMVAILWAQGHNGATVRLEHLWHALCKVQDFSLFCAYPRSGFTQDSAASIQEICAAHSRVIAA